MKSMKTNIIIGAIIFISAAGLAAVGFDGKQILATSIFLMIICWTLFYWKFRLAFAFVVIAVLLGTKLLDVPHVIEFAGLDIILFLVGMMTIIGFLEENHFFEYLVAKVVDKVGERPYLLIGILMGMAALSAALVDEVTSILFMMSTMFHLTKRYRVNPIPFLLMIVFATNIGSSATAVGNPIGVMIALRGKLSFADFLRWASPISLITTAILIPLCFFYFKKAIDELSEQMKKEMQGEKEIAHVHVRKKDITISWLLFLGTIGFLVFHHAMEEMLGLQKNTLLLGTALGAGSLAILLQANNAREFFMRRVDWWTLTFFMALFASVGTLKYVGVTDRIAHGMISLAQGNETLLFFTFSAAISLLTGLMDNVLAVATFIPILFDIEKSGIYTYHFWWGMLFGGTLYGNLTVIGSTANIVAMGMLEREFKQHIKFMEWLKPGFIVSTVTIDIALLLIYLP